MRLTLLHAIVLVEQNLVHLPNSRNRDIAQIERDRERDREREREREREMPHRWLIL